MNNFAQNWLDIQCKNIEGLSSALFLLTDANQESLQAAAQWPKESPASMELVAIAKRAVNEQENVINAEVKNNIAKGAFDYLATPVYCERKLTAVVAVKTTCHNETKRQKIIDSLSLGTKWLELSQPGLKEGREEFYTSVVRLTAACLDHDTFYEAISAFILELTKEFACERVSFGALKGNHVQVIALSNNSKFDSRTNLIRAISGAMDEAIDQDQIIVYPEHDKNSLSIQHAHADLARKFGTGAICTIPLVYKENVCGVLTLERREETPFSPQTVRLCEQTLAIAAPFLKLKQDDEQSLLQKILASGKSLLEKVFGLNHLGYKLFATCVLSLLAFAALTDGDFRIHADAVLEGKIQRTVSAPMDGFIKSAQIRAGDTVVEGEIIASLEDTDLKLEKIKLASEQQQLQREYREAMAKRELVQVRVLNAQIAQIQAQLKLKQEQMERTTISAPFSGIVIEGDLSQSLGAPVERGDSLFKIAPLEGYRIVLKIKETSISYIRHGQSGNLALSSMPNRKFPLRIEKITAVASTEDSGNIFRVEAALPDAPKLLRPGMEGVGKVDVGQKKLLWIWTHEMLDWLKIWAWKWWP